MRSAGAPIKLLARPRARSIALFAFAIGAAVAIAVGYVEQAQAAFSEQRYVVRVRDGDSIEVALPGQTSGPIEIVRFAGINTNEPGMCHAAAASARTRELVENKWVTLSADDPASRASDGRLLRYVDIGDVDVALTLIEESLAFAFHQQAEGARAELYGTASQLASQAGEGIWDNDACGSGPRQGAALRMIIDWDMPGSDKDAANRNGEYFRIHNGSGSDLSMRGWSVRDTTAENIYALSDFARIPAGGYLMVYVGAGTSTATEVYLDAPSQLFVNTGGDAGYLLDPDDDIRAHFSYPCFVSCTDPLQGKISVVANWDAVGTDSNNLNGEWIDIRNDSAAAVDLFEYVLSNGTHRYDFPEGTTIPAGDVLRVHTGSGANTSDTQYWGWPSPLLSNAGGKVVVETYDQIEIAGFTYPCVGQCSDPLQGQIELTANYNAAGKDAENINGEWVNVTNIGDQTISLAGYVMKTRGKIYHFNNDPIHPGERLRVHSGTGNDTRLKKFWGFSQAILGNTESSVYIETLDAIEIDRFAWPCSPCGPTPSLEISAFQSDVPGTDNPNDEWIDITNTGTAAVNLRDWLLRNDDHQLDFKGDRAIQPGATVRVYIGSGNGNASTVYWGHSSSILFRNDRITLWTPHRDLRSCEAWGTRVCDHVVVAPSCNSLAPTIVGTPGDDLLIGTSGADVIVGLGGADTIDGRGGNDVICGGGGADKLLGGAGNDWLGGGSGSDRVSFVNSPRGVTVDLAAGTAEGEGTDTLVGIEGAVGSQFADVLKGGGGRNTLRGEAGNDVLEGRANSDKLVGGPGRDVIRGGGGRDNAEGGGARDRIEGGSGADKIRGGSGPDTLFGNGGDDELRGGSGSDDLRGGPGTDLCISGTTVGCER